MAKQLSLSAESFVLPPIVSVSQVNRRIMMAIGKMFIDVFVGGATKEDGREFWKPSRKISITNG
jgi:hypothetical protein